MEGMTTSINSILKNLIKNFNTLLDCPVRFTGEFNEQKIHCFIEYIEYYKRIKCITDEQALQELQYLLLDKAYEWWMRRKGNIDTWSEALTILENQFSKKRPANVIYGEILKHPYEDYQLKDDFIDDKIELFNELSKPELKEKNKLEIIYALLPGDIQKKIKLDDVTNAVDLKKQLSLAKLDTNVVATIQTNAVLTHEKTLSEEENMNPSNTESECQASADMTSAVAISSERDNTNVDPIIKVRRTEDLMPQDVKEEDKIPLQSEEFITNDGECSATLHSNHDNFQIDNDIMNQINNIIDESEMNIAAMSNSDITATSLPQPSNSVISLEFLGFQIEAADQQKSTGNQSKSSINLTRKTKKRCTYCRHFNHTAQVCFKRAKHMKLFPERFVQTKAAESNNCPTGNNQEEQPQDVPDNISNNNLTNINTETTTTSSTTQHLTNQKSIPQSSPTDPTQLHANSTVILNTIAEKSINPILTTKLIAPINGKAPNKLLAAKLRSINTPSPKCHQCGTLGFYKSICPNCSPIYNNNSHK